VVKEWCIIWEIKLPFLAMNGQEINLGTPGEVWDTIYCIYKHDVDKYVL